MTKIKSRPDLAGNHIRRSRIRFDLAHGRYQTWMAVGRMLHCDDPLRRRRNCVVPQMHRCRTGMIGASQEHELHSRLAHDGLHDAEPSSERLEDWSLLDVKLQIG